MAIRKCTICKKEFYIRPADIKRGRKCCSSKCGHIRRKKLTGKHQPNWKGDNIKYAGLHMYVRKYKKQPDRCEICGKKTKKLDLANISQKYKRDLDDWEYLCRKCHMTKDGRIEIAIKNMKQGLITRYGNK